MADRLRAVWYMAALAFRADPLRASTAAALSIVMASGSAAASFCTSRVVGSIVAGQGDLAVRYAVAAGVLATADLAAALVRLDIRFRLEEATVLVVDRLLVELSTGIPGLEHHERPEHLDRLELLRTQQRMLAGSVGALVENSSMFLQVGTTVGLLLSIHPLLLLLPVFALPSLGVSVRNELRNKAAEEETIEDVRRTNHLFELGTTSAPAKELRVFGLRAEVVRRHGDLVAEVDERLDRLARRNAVATVAGWSLFGAGYVAAIAFVAGEAVAGRASIADVVLAVSLAGQVNGQVAQTFGMVAWLAETLKVVGRYLTVVDDARAAMVVPDDPRPVPERLVDGVRFCGVGFRYPGTEAGVLKAVDLHLPAGATVAVVGDNGAGKSTLIKLLCGFYAPTEGAVEVDGTDLRSFDPVAWRDRMSAGFQDFARLELLAREGVGVGFVPAIEDRAVVGAALERAAAADVVAQLPAGLETQVGKSFEGGIDLSGGQWQKLALGRAMMRERPLLLVLDEPTAALDASAEHQLFERYAAAASSVAAETGGITVLVSHRFSTVRVADLIVVVEAGTVTEVGTHAELVAQAGTYADLYEAQASAYR